MIAPGSTFEFHYDCQADYGASSYNYTVWLFTFPRDNISLANSRLRNWILFWSIL